MLFSIVPMSVFAAKVPLDDLGMTKVSDAESTLVPAVTQNAVVYNKNGRPVEFFVATADLNREDVQVESAYYNDQCAEFGIQQTITESLKWLKFGITPFGLI